MRVAGDTLANLSNLSRLLVPSAPSEGLVHDELPCELDEEIGEIKMVVNASNYEKVLDKEWRLLVPSISYQFPVISYETIAAPTQLLSLNVKKSINSLEYILLILTGFTYSVHTL